MYKFNIGERIEWHNMVGDGDTGTIVKTDNDCSSVQWDCCLQGTLVVHDNSDLVPMDFYSDFQDKIKDRLE